MPSCPEVKAKEEEMNAEQEDVKAVEEVEAAEEKEAAGELSWPKHQLLRGSGQESGPLRGWGICTFLHKVQNLMLNLMLTLFCLLGSLYSLTKAYHSTFYDPWLCHPVFTVLCYLAIYYGIVFVWHGMSWTLGFEDRNYYPRPLYFSIMAFLECVGVLYQAYTSGLQTSLLLYMWAIAALVLTMLARHQFSKVLETWHLQRLQTRPKWPKYCQTNGSY